MRKASLTLIVLLLLLTGCSISQYSSEPSSSFNSAKLPVFSDGVDFVIETLSTQDNKIYFIGKTNLPDGTKLMFQLDNKDLNYIGQCTATVEKGIFKSEHFSNGGNPLKPGEYKLEVLTPIAAVQPNSIREIVGPNGENYKGQYIAKFNSDTIIKYIQKVNIK
jgi:hypothetical protein